MPRSNIGVASAPPQTEAISGDPISSVQFNALRADIYAILNLLWPLGLLPSIADQGGQPSDATLTGLAALETGADKLPYSTGTDTFAQVPFLAWAREFIGAGNISLARTALSVQPLDASLSSIADLTLAQGDILYATGPDTIARLPKGAANQVLRMNDDATAPEYAPPMPSDGEMPLYPARAWCEFTVVAGVVTVTGSANVTLVQRNSVGNFSVVFTVAMPNENYGYSISPQGTILNGFVKTTSSISSVTANPSSGAALDAPRVSLAIFA